MRTVCGVEQAFARRVSPPPLSAAKRASLTLGFKRERDAPYTLGMAVTRARTESFFIITPSHKTQALTTLREGLLEPIMGHSFPLSLLQCLFALQNTAEGKETCIGDESKITALSARTETFGDDRSCSGRHLHTARRGGGICALIHQQRRRLAFE